MALREADVKQIELQRDALGAQADAVVADINSYLATINSDFAVNTANDLVERASDLIRNINTARETPNVLEGRSDPEWSNRVAEAVTDLAVSRNTTADALTELQQAIADAGTREPLPEDATNSAAQIAGDDGLNRTEDATVQNPELESDQGANAIETNSNADETTTRGLADFNDQTTNAVSEDTGLQAPTNPTTQSGQNNIRVAVGYDKEINPSSNVLSKFGTSTYNITIYMITPDQYNKMMGYDEEANANDADAQAVKSVEGFNAILASGGLPGGFVGDPYTAGGAFRNRFFDLDYFIDDLEIQTLMPQQVRGATNVTQLNFKITEPYGFTFLNRLKNASEDLIANENPEARLGAKDWIKQHYLMVIRFYGEEGQSATASDVETGGGTGADGTVNVTASRPLTEKYIPFQFTNITTRAATGAVEYMCSAVPINHLQAMGQKNSTAKYQVEIKGQTLENLFNGQLSQEVDGNDTRLLSTGMLESLNRHYKELEAKGVIGIAPEFEVKFRGGIGKQKVKAPGTTKKERTAMANVNPALISTSSNTVQKNILNFSINAGSQIQHILDQCIRASEWITAQQKKYIDPNTRDVKNKSSNNLLQWYRITSSVRVLGWDEIRKDYAYKIIYQVTPSAVSDVKSPAFPRRKFNGCQKRYKYWFTGENTEILNYEVDFNALYYVSSSPLIAQNKADVSTIGETTNPGPPDQTVIQGSDLSADPAARAASVLYSPTDYALLNMKILGDPDYIQQGDIFWRSLGVQDNNPGYLPDGSVDYDSGECLIEVDYNTMEDYDETTGMADLRPIELKDQNEIENTTTGSGQVYKGLIYQVTQVNNQFSKGVFTQDIQGILKQYPDVEETEGSTLDNGPVVSTNVREVNYIPSILISAPDDDAG